MYIDENTLSGVLNNFGNLNKGRIKKRFDKVEQVFREIGNIVCEDFKSFRKVEKWEDGEIKKLNGQYDRKIFAPCHIGLTDDKRYGGILLQKKYFEHSNYDNKIKKGQNYLSSEGRGKLVVDILSIIGGFDSRGKMKDEYRILSNAQTSKDDFNSTLQSNGQYAWINSHFADNTLFCEFVDFVKECNNNEVKSEWYKNIALCYPYADDKKTIGKLSGSKEDIKQETNKQQDILAYRFPLKFLWMWANKDNVIHPLSLMAFRDFLKSEFMSEVFKILSQEGEQCFSGFSYDDNNKTMGEEFSTYAEKITNAKIEYFPRIWGEVSKAIMVKLFGKEWEGQKIDNLKKASQLISLLTLGETDMTNIDELLKTHKQIILYGVPGTGKTHSAKKLIKSKIKQDWDDDKDKLKDYQFGAILNNESELFTFDEKKGIQTENEGIGGEAIWDMMQFHPNTTYQDFIGGIIPKTKKDGSLTYEVESGKFKKFCEYASVNSTTPFVFIIDEINRANLSEVLGELLYALEYRDEGITIPNFNKPFVIPSNVYIIGTMNNVDKSLSTFDLALRRRFGFYEVGVDCDMIEKMLEGKVEEKVLEKYIERCQDLNALLCDEIDESNEERLKQEKSKALGLEKHYKIGQAYFAKIEKFFESNKVEKITPIHLTKLWDYHLQPLIEEYVGFSMNSKEVSDKLDNLKTFWIKAI